jgi:uncharacterized protein YjdB
MKKISILLIAIIMGASLIQVSPAFAGRGPGGGGGGGVCQNILTAWESDPSKDTLSPNQTGTYFLNITNNCANDQQIKLQSADSGLAFDPASFALAKGAKVRIKVTVKMPAQNGRLEAWFTIKIVCSVGSGKEVKFKIRFKDAPCCTYVASWVSNPNGKKVDGKSASVFPLDITNKCVTSISFTMSSGSSGVKFSKTSFTLAGGKTERVNVIVTPPARRLTNKIEYSVTITTLCGATKKLTFVLEYK